MQSHDCGRTWYLYSSWDEKMEVELEAARSVFIGL